MDIEEITKSAAVTPILNVKNLEASFDYYVKKLKFIKAWDWGEPATFGSVYFGDKVEIFFCEDGQGQPGTWMMIFVKDVDAYLNLIEPTGANIVYGPVDEPHGVREFHVKDPDGHIIRFGSGIKTASEPVRPG